MARIRGHVVEVRAGANMIIGGAKDSELNDWQVMPVGAPSGPVAVTTVMPEQNAPRAARMVGRDEGCYIDAHTVGFDELPSGSRSTRPSRWRRSAGWPAPEQIRAAARVLGHAQRLLSTVPQGFYQQVQVVDLHRRRGSLMGLIRGMLGRPGCGILQMHGQPTAQNTRECGADDDMSGFRNWSNDAHVADLAGHWNLDPFQIPHMTPPTHAMQIFRHVEEGSGWSR